MTLPFQLYQTACTMTRPGLALAPWPRSSTVDSTAVGFFVPLAIVTLGGVRGAPLTFTPPIRSARRWRDVTADFGL